MGKVEPFKTQNFASSSALVADGTVDLRSIGLAIDVRTGPVDEERQRKSQESSTNKDGREVDVQRPLVVHGDPDRDQRQTQQRHGQVLLPPKTGEENQGRDDEESHASEPQVVDRVDVSTGAGKSGDNAAVEHGAAMKNQAGRPNDDQNRIDTGERRRPAAER